MLAPDRMGHWRRWLTTLQREVGRDDPDALRQMIELRDELTALIPHAARAIHSQGYSWTDIGNALDIHRVTAYQRFAERPVRGQVVDVVEGVVDAADRFRAANAG